jgi:hypothetical protein
MAHFLDDLPFDPGRRESSHLLGILRNAYLSVGKTQALLRKIRVGVNGTSATFPVADIHWERTPTEFWEEILITARNQLLLRDLVEIVLDDPDARAYGDQVRALLNAPEEPAAIAQSSDAEPSAEAVLDDPTWDLIARLLASHVLGSAEPRTALDAVLPALLLAGLKLEGDADQNLHEVIEALKESRLLEEVPPILHALEAMLGVATIAAKPESEYLRAAAVSVREFVGRLRARPPARDALDECVLFNGEVFLNRNRLREGLKSLLGPKLALVVKGPAHSGKSYSSQLILHLAKTKGFKVAKVTHEEAASAEELVDFLRMSMKIEEPLKFTRADQEKWNRHAGRWLVSEAQRSGGKYWFVIDGFNKDRIDGSIKEVITALTQYIAEETEGSLRVVLLDYDEPLPHQVGNRQLKEELAFLKETDVREFFISFFGDPRRGVRGPVEEYVEVKVKEAWQTAEKNDEGAPERSFMARLKDEVERVVGVHA